MGIPWKVRQSGFSAHALARMQQRGIHEYAVDLLFRYGREEHDHRGHTIIYFDKKARRRMKREMRRPHPGPPPQAEEGIDEGPLPQAGAGIDMNPPRLAEARICERHRRQQREGIHSRPRPQAKEDCLNLRIYAVLSRSGDIVTVGHRYARIWRH